MTITVSDVVIATDLNRLTNQIWKLIPMKENNENWQDHLSLLLLELTGLNILSGGVNVDFLVLLSKLTGLRELEVDFPIFRKTVFECITLLRGLRL